MMKRTVLLLAAALVVLGACKKTQPDDSNKPTVAWEANPSFDLMEIGVNMDAKVSLTVPEGVESLVVRITEIPTDLRGIVKKEISISGNKNDLIMDLVSDANIASAFSGFVSPRQVSAAKSVTLNFTPLLYKIAEGQLLNNDDRFTFELTMLDAAENKLAKTIRFRWTSGPEITWTPKDKKVVFKADTEEYPCKLAIVAPGRIESLVLSFEGTSEQSVDAGLMAYIKKVAGGNAIDLIAQSTVAQKLSLPGAEIKSKTALEIDLKTFLGNLSLVADGNGSSTQMKIVIVDELGKSLEDALTIEAE